VYEDGSITTGAEYRVRLDSATNQPKLLLGSHY
jgi:hypothetical protein